MGSAASSMPDGPTRRLASQPRARARARAESGDQVPEQFRRPTCDCAGGLKLLAHRGGGGEPGHVWAVPGEDCCGRAGCLCPACVARATRHRARRVKRRIEAVRDVSGEPAHLLHVVLTWPDDCRPPSTVHRRELAEMRRLARRVVKSWLYATQPGLEGGEPGRDGAGWHVGGWEVFHPEGDRELGVWRPHIHMTILGLAWRDGVWQQLRCHQTEESLELLRWLWGGALRLYLGTDCPADRVVVHYAYRQDTPEHRPQYEHRLRYDLRHWPEYAPSATRLVYWGILSPAAVSKTRAIVLEPEADDSEAEDPLACPCCGQPCDHIISIRLERLVLEREPAWVADCLWVDRETWPDDIESAPLAEWLAGKREATW